MPSEPSDPKATPIPPTTTDTIQTNDPEVGELDAGPSEVAPDGRVSGRDGSMRTSGVTVDEFGRDDVPITIEVPVEDFAAATGVSALATRPAQRYPSPFGPNGTLVKPAKRSPSRFDRVVGTKPGTASFTAPSLDSSSRSALRRDAQPAASTGAAKSGESLGPAALDIVPELRARPKLSRATVILGAATVILAVLDIFLAVQQQPDVPTSATILSVGPATRSVNVPGSADGAAVSREPRENEPTTSSQAAGTSKSSAASVVSKVPSTRVDRARRTRPTATKKNRGTDRSGTSEDSKDQKPLGHYVPDEL